MTFMMRSGHRVRTVALGGGLTEFTTRNAAGETISTVVLPAGASARTLKHLRRNAR